MSSSTLTDSIAPNQTCMPTVTIEPRKGLFDLDLEALWEYRELPYFLVWRNVKVRYKQQHGTAQWLHSRYEA